MRDQVLTPWVYRRWTFTTPTELYPAVLERLRGTPARVAVMVAGRPEDVLSFEPDDGWSVKRQISHLADLDGLLGERLDAYERGEPLIPPADMSNAATVATELDKMSTADVVARFERTRRAAVERVEAYPRDFFGRSAWHERLGVQKRVVDSLQFFADHDDHHLVLARMVLKRV